MGAQVFKCRVGYRAVRGLGFVQGLGFVFSIQASLMLFGNGVTHKCWVQIQIGKVPETLNSETAWAGLGKSLNPEPPESFSASLTPTSCQCQDGSESVKYCGKEVLLP